jgi:predicted anti-sigma-YlaC factor YlaD
MKTDEDSPLFGPDGHLEEWALSALADGEDVGGVSADAHLSTCEACTQRFVAFASLSVDMGERLRGAAGVALPAVPAKAQARAPWRAVALVLAVALVIHLPLVTRLPALLVAGAGVLVHAGPVLVRGVARTLATPEGASLVFATTALASVLFIALGLVVARRFQSQGALS